MRAIPSGFLNRLADQYGLTSYEKEAFLERLKDTKKTDIVVAKELNISRDRYSSRMTGVYKKFGIDGSGPGKLVRLLSRIFEIYQRDNPNSYLDLDYEEVNTFVEEVNEKLEPLIRRDCGSMRVLDTNYPVEVTAIYTEVQVSDHIASSRHIQIADLIRDFNPEIDDFHGAKLGITPGKRFAALKFVEHHPRLVILGKPGSGKTTFLKFLAIQCIRQALLADHVPIFIPLRRFAEDQVKPDLFQYILKKFELCGLERYELEQLLNYSRLLILLDGLDEVTDADRKHITNQIQAFSNKFSGNRFIITCRSAAQEYAFERFTEVEIADFNGKQIIAFSKNWFRFAQDEPKSAKFIAQLKQNRRIQELATSPLLLTLLCIVFGDSGDFPTNRSELYEEGLDVLLKRWDAKRNIERGQTYRNLSRQRKEDLLSQIAYTTFDRGEYFFKQKTVEYEVKDYIKHLPDVSRDLKSLQLDSNAVLKAIEVQHGLLVERARTIYSFSHLTFHVYFVARKIVNIPDPKAQEQALVNLVSHISEKRWREVFLLAIGMLPNSDYLLGLMKIHANNLMAADQHLQKFLGWVNQKAASVKGPPSSIQSRIFYFALDIMLPKARSIYQGSNVDLDLDFDLTYALNRAQNLSARLERIDTLSTAEDEEYCLERIQDHRRVLSRTLISALNQTPDLSLRKSLQQLTEALPPAEGKAILTTWKANGHSWTEELREILMRHRNIGHDWHFTRQQTTLLKRYYEANTLLLSCLSRGNDCYASRGMRREIRDSLFSPS